MNRSEAELQALERQASIFTGPLVPLLPPIKPSQPIPQLPVRTSCDTPFGSKRTGWQCDTFVIPAAFPRSISGSSRKPGEGVGVAVPVPSKDPKVKVDLITAQYNIYEPQVKASRKEVNVDNPEDYANQEQLHLAVNRYSRSHERRKGKSTEDIGLTLVFAHANGFHKEIWEPTIADLLDDLDGVKDPKVLPIDEIWTLDSVCQGDSAILNEEVLGNTFNWADNGRDILNFIISYIDSPSLPHAGEPRSSSHRILQPVSAPQELLMLDGNQSKQPSSPPDYISPSNRVFRKRKIIGIGHSLGGGGMIYASSARPELFSSILLLDPVVIAIVDFGKSVKGLTGGAIIRKDTWESRDAAMSSFLKKPFFAAWDRRVLERYIDFGCKEVEGKGVVLKTKPLYEALVFADPMGVWVRRAGARLSQIPPSLPVHFIFAEVNRSVMDEPQIWAVLKNVPHATAARIHDAGHLIAQEQPGRTAAAIAHFLRRTYPVKTESVKGAKL